jgi:hypothetical protein
MLSNCLFLRNLWFFSPIVHLSPVPEYIPTLSDRPLISRSFCRRPRFLRPAPSWFSRTKITLRFDGGLSSLAPAPGVFVFFAVRDTSRPQISKTRCRHANHRRRQTANWLASSDFAGMIDRRAPALHVNATRSPCCHNGILLTTSGTPTPSDREAQPGPH